MESMDIIEKYMDVLLNSDIHSLVVKSLPGMGKTTTILNKLGSLGLEEGVHYIYVTGYMTPLKLYDTLSKSRTLDTPKLLVLDDLDSILKNRTSIALLKGALAEARGKRIVSYESSARNADVRHFEFTGKVILIVNNLVKSNIIESLLDRGIFYDMEIDQTELATYIELNMPSMYQRLSLDEKKSIWGKVKRLIDSPNFSLRALNRAFAFYQNDPENWYELWLKTMKVK